MEGTDPSWAPDGNEIYYRSGPRLMAARVDKTAGVKVLASRIVIDPFLPPLRRLRHPPRRPQALRCASRKPDAGRVTTVLNWLKILVGPTADSAFRPITPRSVVRPHPCSRPSQFMALRAGGLHAVEV